VARADIGLTTPTRGGHPDLLAGIIAASGLPAERIVIVATAPDIEPEGATVIEDLGDNSHRLETGQTEQVHSGLGVATTFAHAAVNGILSAKIHRHPMVWVSNPPISGPAALPRPAIPYASPIIRLA
jgi:hypothetical protein